MFGKASNSSIKPSALGATVQSATYGQVIRPIIGRAQTALSLIWAANLRKGSGTGKKGKGLKSKKGKGAPQYAQNVDFLLGCNPMQGVLQVWENQNQKYPLNFVRYQSSAIDALNRTVTIPDDQFYMVVGVTVTEFYSMIVNDYGGPGPVTLQGNWEAPCWNSAQVGPDPTSSSCARYFPYVFYWTQAMGNTLRKELGTLLTCNVYYAQLWPDGNAAYGKKQSGTAVPIGALHLTFESVLGSGPEYAGTDQTTHQALNKQQLLYPMYAGLGSDRLDMGSSTAVPDIRPEVLGSYSMYATGDAEFADMLQDIVAQGQGQAGAAIQYATDLNGNIVTGSAVPNGDGSSTLTDANGLTYTIPAGTGQTPPFTKLQRGIGAFDFPGPIQLKHCASVESFNMAGPVYYDQNITAGNFLVVVATSGTSGGASLSIGDAAGHAWVPIFPGGGGYQAWYAPALATTEPNPVTVSPLGYNASITIMELAGVDALDSVVLGTALPQPPGTGPTATATITTSNDQGKPAYILGISPYLDINPPPAPTQPFWRSVVSAHINGIGLAAHQLLQSRTVYAPGSYTLQQVTNNFSPYAGFALLAFKATEPSPYPRPLGHLLDEATLELTRSQDRAYGLYGSLVMDSQQKASDWMETLYQAMNAAPVMSGFTLKSIPKSEKSFAGNGAYYTAPTASGPVARLKASDFIETPGQPLILCERVARTDIPNVLQIQCKNRDGDYYDTTVSETESGSVALYSPRKDSPKRFDMIMDPAIGRKVMNVMVKERNYKVNNYTFTLNAKWKRLDPMDLVTLPDPDTLLQQDEFGNDITLPVQLTKIVETDKLQLQCEAQDFIYGCCAPDDLTVTPTAKNQVLTGRSPGLINTPILFEPLPRLCKQANQGEVWAVVSHAFVPAPVLAPVPTIGAGTMLAGDYSVLVTYVNAAGAESLPSPAADVILAADGGSITVPSPVASATANRYNVYLGKPGQETLQNTTPLAIGTAYTQSAPPSGSLPPPTNNYGGCFVYLSTDGGASYKQVGTIDNSAVTGVLAADWPAAADPDTTNNLLLDLTESAGELEAIAVADEDNFVYPCYVEGGGTNFIPYELMAFAVPTLTDPYQYTLEATGTGNKLRRSLFSAPAVGVGVDHPLGSRWTLLNPSGAGIFKINMDPLWIGQTLYFKFLPVNTFGGGSPDSSTVQAWPYTPIGVAQNQNPNMVNYTNTPGPALSLTNATTVHMDTVQVQFPGNTVHYNARDFTIPSLNTTYYVTIHDPGYLGDIGAALTRTAYCETSQAKVGVAGYVYMGSIGPAATAGGGTTPVVTPGGMPIPTLYLVNGQ